MLNLVKLHDAIAAVCPIVGVSIGDPGDKTTWRIDFDAEATDAQKAAAQAVVLAYVESPPAPQFDFLGFVALFTADERAAIFGSDDPDVKQFTFMAAGSPILHLDDARVIGGVGYLASMGLVASGRIAAILAGTAPAG